MPLEAMRVFVLLQLLVMWTQSLINGTTLKSDEKKDTYTLPDDTFLKDGDTFDFIVVGAGAAGCAVAARLALLDFIVLLLEAGGNPNLLSRATYCFHNCKIPSADLANREIPAASMGLLGTDIDWQYPTISNNVSCLSSRGRACRFSRGKCLGGSTSINYMLYTRGNRQDFNFGITDWNWKDLKPYFLRYEGLQVLDQFPRSSVPYHNTTGILKVEFFDDPKNPWQSRIVKGYRDLKFPYNGDMNGVSQIGVGKLVGYTYEGERMSTARAYLGREDVQKTLKVAKNTLCTGLIIDDNNVIQGITVLPKLALLPLKLYARKEVILSAGAIGTPQILMLSGIGNAEHLQEMDIPVRANLPVGDNMSDHVLPLMFILVDKGIKGAEDLGILLNQVKGTAEFLAAREGPLASNGLTDISTFANSFCYSRKQRQLQHESDDCELPNLQIIHAYINRNIIPLGKKLVQQGTDLNDDVIDQLAAANVNGSFIIMSPVLLTPYSRGNIRLKTKNPRDLPAIFPNYLSDRRDVDQILCSIKIVEDLVETPIFKKNTASILHLQFPGCPSYEESWNDYWRCYTRHMTYAVFHAVGTCSLEKVVDIKLRVKGFKHLRVADASIFPKIPRGNTEAPTVAVGERVVDFIKEVLGKKNTKNM